MAETSTTTKVEQKTSFDSVVAGGSESGKDLHMKNALVGVNKVFFNSRQ